MRISDRSSDVCSSDLQRIGQLDVAGREIGLELIFEAAGNRALDAQPRAAQFIRKAQRGIGYPRWRIDVTGVDQDPPARLEAPAAFGPDFGRALPFHLGCRRGRSRRRSEEHTSELPSLMRTPHAVF